MRDLVQHGRRFCNGFAGLALPAAILSALVACHAPSPRAAAPGGTPPAAAQPADDAAYDWHGLLIAPFGSALKDIPGGLHEVLLFRDDAHDGHGQDARSGPADDAECYSTDAPAPRFMGRTPDEYLLCFKRDRLARIQASVRLTAEDAPARFAAACAAWLRHAAPASEPGNAGGCDGRDGAIRFSGRLGDETGLTITLDGVPDP
jgi:hypothetical protein